MHRKSTVRALAILNGFLTQPSEEPPTSGWAVIPAGIPVPIGAVNLAVALRHVASEARTPTRLNLTVSLCRRRRRHGSTTTGLPPMYTPGRRWS